MQTTLELSETLLEEAKDLTQIQGEAELITFALESVIKQKKNKSLSDYFGKVDLELDLNTLRSRGNNE
jgi:hypothetical protein